MHINFILLYRLKGWNSKVSCHTMQCCCMEDISLWIAACGILLYSCSKLMEDFAVGDPGWYDVQYRPTDAQLVRDQERGLAIWALSCCFGSKSPCCMHLNIIMLKLDDVWKVTWHDISTHCPVVMGIHSASTNVQLCLEMVANASPNNYTFSSPMISLHNAVIVALITTSAFAQRFSGRI